MRDVVRSACWIVLLALVAAPVQAQRTVAAEPLRVMEMNEQAMQAVEQMHAARRAQARPIDLFSPFYSVAGDDETVIYLLNAVAEPVRVELTALGVEGEVLPLGEFQVGVTRHVTIPLREAIRPAGRQFHQGSLRLSLIGDAYTVQAWSVVNRGPQYAEFQFQPRYKTPRNDMAALWDSNAAGGARAVFHLVNTGDSPLAWQAEFVGRSLPDRVRPIEREDPPRIAEREGRQEEEEELRQLAGTLDPGQSHRLELGLGASFLRIRHDGHRGALRVAGLLEGRDHLSLIPVVGREEWEQTRVHEAIRVSWDPKVRGSAVLSLFNVSDEETRATVEAFDSVSGARLLRSVERIPPGQPFSLDVGGRLAAMRGRDTGRDLRLRVAANRPGLLVAGKSRQADGSFDDVTLLHPQNAHASGSYPMLPLNTHEVFLTLLNVGDLPADIVAQFYWDGGTYSYGPVRIEANASYRLAVDDVLAEGRPDMLGRKLNPRHRQGFLKWSARGGSNAIVGRTEVRPRGGRDTFGFNCHACCGEIPSGVVIPESVDFFVGATPSFEAAYNIGSCNGTMGPFPAYPTSFNVPAPFTWNGVNVGASGPASENTTFHGYAQGTLPGTICVYRLMGILGFGRPNSCKTLLKKAHNPTQSWSVHATCVSQVGSESSGKCSKCQACCNQILAWKLCTKTGLFTANSEHELCLGNCATDVC